MEQSPNLEKVDIRAWAQQIREVKIRELRELLVKEEKRKEQLLSIKPVGFREAGVNAFQCLANANRIETLKHKIIILSK